MRGTIGGRCVLRVRRISSYSSSAPFAAPTMIAASSPWKYASVRPAYIGLPWMPEAGRAGRDVGVDQPGVLEHEALGDERLLEADAVRAAALQAERVAPVVEHRPRLARGDEEEHPPGRPAVLLGRSERLAHVVRRVRCARRVRVRARQLPAAVDALRAPRRRGHGGAEEVAVAEQLGLRLLLEEHADLERMAGREAQAPGGRRAAARERDHRSARTCRGRTRARRSASGRARRRSRPSRNSSCDLLRVVGALLGLGLAARRGAGAARRARDDRELGSGGIASAPSPPRATCSRSVASRSTTRPSGSSSGSPVTTTP